jgi:hypothetical protein
MSTALAVRHGSFGGLRVHRVDKPMRTLAHRGGYLTFRVGGPPAIVKISNVPHLVNKTASVAINLPVVNCPTSDVREPVPTCASRRSGSATSRSVTALARRGK